MPGLNKNRKRSKTVAFRASPDEVNQIDARIAVSGLQKQDYIIQSLLHNKVIVRFGRYESEKLSVQLILLRRKIEELMEYKDTEQLLDVLDKCLYFLDELYELIQIKNEIGCDQS